MYLCVHFQRYLFANVEDIDTKRERFSQKREVAFCCFLQKKGRRIFETQHHRQKRITIERSFTKRGNTAAHARYVNEKHKYDDDSFSSVFLAVLSLFRFWGWFFFFRISEYEFRERIGQQIFVRIALEITDRTDHAAHRRAVEILEQRGRTQRRDEAGVLERRLGSESVREKLDEEEWVEGQRRRHGEHFWPLGRG